MSDCLVAMKRFKIETCSGKSILDMLDNTKIEFKNTFFRWFQHHLEYSLPSSCEVFKSYRLVQWRLYDCNEDDEGFQQNHHDEHGWELY